MTSGVVIFDIWPLQNQKKIDFFSDFFRFKNTISIKKSCLEELI